jgi:hypothetical protein
MASEERTVWMIRVAGYGTFEFTGTEAEAEATRGAKAQWEHGSGMKWRKDLLRESDRIGAQMAALFEQGEGVPMEMLRKRAEARKREAILGVLAEAEAKNA